ncbi:MAG: hypothetical protein GXO73_02735 [Calditrichaeota bacterium]|nr:hypothetical protein [Calditrichota bacterium]
MGREKWLTVLLVAGLLVPRVSRAQGGYAGAFLRLGVSAETVALGEALTAATNQGYSLFFNPAGLTRLERRQLRASYALLSLDRKLTALGFSTSVGPEPGAEQDGGERAKPRAGIGLGWVHAGVDNIDGRDFDGRPTGMLSNSENAFYFGFGMQPHRLFSLGLAGKILYNRFPGMTETNGALTARGFGVDVGVLVGPFGGLTLGAVVRDINSRYTWNTEHVWEHGTTTVDRFPRVWRVGAAYRFLEGRALILGQAEDSDVGDPRLQVGAEWEAVRGVLFRAGMRGTAPSFGLGFSRPLLGRQFTLNYAVFSSNSEAPRVEHWLGWAVEF